MASWANSRNSPSEHVLKQSALKISVGVGVPSGVPVGVGVKVTALLLSLLLSSLPLRSNETTIIRINMIITKARAIAASFFLALFGVECGLEKLIFLVSGIVPGKEENVCGLVEFAMNFY